MLYVELKNISKNYSGEKAMQDANLQIEKGSLTALLGPSGSGKTTLLRIIAGLEKPDSGDVFIDGKKVNDIPPDKRGIGFVFQSYALFRYMTVFDNIAFGLSRKKYSSKEIKEKVQELLELTELTGLEKRYPNQLSGGERQRVAFARALAPDPSLLLLDEPFAAIDAKVRKDLRIWLRDTIHKVGITSIFVTHDQDEAAQVADSIIITSSGKIEQVGTPEEIYKAPETPFVASFIGNGTTLTCSDLKKLRGFSEGEFKGAIIRPEFIQAFKNDNPRFKDLLDFSEKGVITDVLFRGGFIELKINVNGIILTVNRSLERRQVKIGEEMNVIIYRIIAFDETKTYLLSNKEIDSIPYC